MKFLRYLAAQGPTFAFALGIGIPLFVRIAGELTPVQYDALVLPILERRLLPALPIIALIAAVLAVMHSESLRDSAVALFVLGAAVGLPLVNDWWYLAPYSVAGLTAVTVWQIQLRWWSRAGGAARMAGALLSAVLVGGLFNLRRHTGLDPRFGFGFHLTIEGGMRIAVLVALGVAVLFWIRWLWAGEPRHHALLADLFETEPRAARYLAGSAALTRIGFDVPPALAGVRRRGQSSATLNDKAARTPTFHEARNAPRFASTYRAVALALGRFLPITLLLRFLRPPARDPGHPSPLIREILGEGARREFGNYLTALLGSKPETGDLLSELSKMSAEEVEARRLAADLHFTRHVQFREALIDAHHCLFLKVERASPADWSAEAAILQKRLGECLRLPVSRAPKEPAPQPGEEAANIVSTHLAAAVGDALGLWGDALDRLFLHFGDRMVAAGSASVLVPVDLAELTCHLLALRRAQREASPVGNLTAHEAAADLALWLFVGALIQPKGADELFMSTRKILKDYFEKMRAPGAEPPWDEVGLAGSAYGLACGALGDWQEGARPFTILKKMVSSTDAAMNARLTPFLRVSGHVDAGLALTVCRTSFRARGVGGMNANDHCLRVLATHQRVDQSPPSSLPGVVALPARLRSLFFVLHLERAENEALQSVRARMPAALKP